jgi:hypothetical protein
MPKPTNFDYAFYKKNKPKDLKDDPKVKINMDYLHVHYIHYPTLSLNSKDNKVMRDRVNDIRQMTTGLTKTRESIMLAIKNCKPGKHDAFNIILHEYLELLRKAEHDRQNWIKMERGVGNLANLNEILIEPGLDDIIRI